MVGGKVLTDRDFKGWSLYPFECRWGNELYWCFVICFIPFSSYTVNHRQVKLAGLMMVVFFNHSELSILQFMTRFWLTPKCPVE